MADSYDYVIVDSGIAWLYATLSAHEREPV